MEFIIESEGFKQSYFDFIVSFLDEKYKKLPIKVAVCDSIEKAKKHFPTEIIPKGYWEDVKSHRTHASFSDKDLVIVLYTVGMEEIDYSDIILDFYHEIRHAYQFFYMNDIWTYESKRYNRNLPPGEYHEQWCEKDAEYFSYKIFKKNKAELSKKFNFKIWFGKGYKPPEIHPLQKEK